MVFRSFLFTFFALWGLWGYAYMNTGTKNLPPPDQTGLIPTLNKYGWMTPQLNPISKRFVDYTLNLRQGKVLDIGTAYGYVPTVILNSSPNSNSNSSQNSIDPTAENTVSVVANDLSLDHLQILLDSTSSEKKRRLEINTDRFPNRLNFPPESLNAVLACRVFHFLKGEEIEEGLRKIYLWLKPGGKVFVFSNSPYRKSAAAYHQDYEQKKTKMRYPGVVSELSLTLPDLVHHLPSFVHHIDLEIMSRLFTEAGFEIEDAFYLQVETLPEVERLDGREDVGMVARKPILQVDADSAVL